MQVEIPILVTRSNFKDPLIFQNPTATIFQRVKSKRNPTVPKTRPRESQPRHQTLDSDQQAGRTRRVSSSAASRRFPKDFFKDQVCLNPIKSHKLPHKQAATGTMLDTFSHKNFIAAEGEYLMPEKEPSMEDTPKFSEKKGGHSSHSQKSIAQKLINMKIQSSYVPQKSKYNTCPEGEPHAPLASINPLQPIIKNIDLDTFPLASNFHMTLGVKDPLITLLQKGHQFRKKREPREKQNHAFGRKAAQSSNKRESVPKIEGFRIRKKVLG